MPSRVTPSKSTTLLENSEVESTTTRQSPYCTGSPTTWNSGGDQKLGPDLNLCLSSGTPQCPGLTNRSNCPSLPTRNSRPTCRNSLPTLFVSIDMFLYRTIYRPRRSKRCRAKRSARHYGTTSGPSPTSAETHANARSLQKSTLEYNLQLHQGHVVTGLETLSLPKSHDIFNNVGAGNAFFHSANSSRSTWISSSHGSSTKNGYYIDNNLKQIQD